MLSVGMSPGQWTGRTPPDLSAVGLNLIWEQEAAGSNPAIPTRSEHMSILADHGSSAMTSPGVHFGLFGPLDGDGRPWWPGRTAVRLGVGLERGFGPPVR